MFIRAEQRYLRISPQKIRFVAQAVKGVKSPLKAVAFLENIQKQAALPLSKVIKQAIANAGNSYNILPEDLTIRELLINEGPSLKRGQPISRGRFHPILKQTSHVRVILESIDKKVVQKVLKEPKIEKEKIKNKNEKRQNKKEEYGTKS